MGFKDIKNDFKVKAPQIYNISNINVSKFNIKSSYYDIEEIDYNNYEQKSENFSNFKKNDGFDKDNSFDEKFRTHVISFTSILFKIIDNIMLINTGAKISHKITSIIKEIEKKLISRKIELGIFDFKQFDYSNIKKDGFMPQGVTTTKNGYIISAHNNGKDNSRLYFYGKDGKSKGYIVLDNKAHVGGITFDNKNEKLFVTGSNGNVVIYDYSIIERAFKNDLSFSGQKITDLKVPKTEFNVFSNGSNIATCYYYKNKLYCISYEGIVSEENLVSYATIDISKDNKGNNMYDITEVYTNDLPRQVQGIAVTDYKDKKYALVVQGGFQGTDLLVYEIGGKYNELKKCVGEVDLGNFLQSGYTGGEGIKIQDDGQVILISENIDKSKVMTMDEIFIKMKKPFSNHSSSFDIKTELGNIFDGESLVEFDYEVNEFFESVAGYIYENGYTEELNSIASKHGYKSKKTIDFIAKIIEEMYNEGNTSFTEKFLYKIIELLYSSIT